ncbi:MAG: adenosine deaminase [Clostridiales bacterium]|nr:adenosine deaminase [Clostridiales bacterium]
MVSFETALIENSISELMLVPKSDIHTHGGKGGRIKYFAEWANTSIEASEQPFEDLIDMQNWFNSNIKIHDNSIVGYLKRVEAKRVEAAFAQAKEDNIVVLALSFGIGVIDDLGGIDKFISTLNYLNKTFAPETKYYPELSFSREDDVNEACDRLDEILSKNWFKSIDICGNELTKPIKNFQKIYRKAQGYGVKLKAHVGVYGK